MVRWCWVNFQCWGVHLIWLIVGQGPTALAVGAGGGCLYIFTLIYLFSYLSSSLWDRLKYCLKGPLTQNNQPTVVLVIKVTTNTIAVPVIKVVAPRVVSVVVPMAVVLTRETTLLGLISL